MPSDFFKYLFGFIGLIVILLLIFKIIFYHKSVIADLSNHILAAVFGTFPMALMILSTYFSDGFYLWSVALIVHLALIVYYTLRFIPKFCLKNQYTSLFIVYIGVGMATITGSQYYPQLTNFLLIFASLSAIILVPLLGYRYIKYPVHSPFKPLICIYSAPVSLLIVAYLQSSFYKSQEILLVLFILAFLLFLFSLAEFVHFRSLDFYPSYSAYTFPFVITANVSLSLISFFPGIWIIAVIQLSIAIFMVSYVLIRYVLFLNSV